MPTPGLAPAMGKPLGSKAGAEKHFLLLKVITPSAE